MPPLRARPGRILGPQRRHGRLWVEDALESRLAGVAVAGSRIPVAHSAVATTPLHGLTATRRGVDS